MRSFTKICIPILLFAVSGDLFAKQTLQSLGLNQQEASYSAATVNSAYNRMANSDFSTALEIIQATRGLLTFDDIRESQGDPVKLALTFRKKVEQNNIGLAQAKGMAEMAGLPGFAPTTLRAKAAIKPATPQEEKQKQSDLNSYMSEIKYTVQSKLRGFDKFSGKRATVDVGIEPTGKISNASCTGDSALCTYAVNTVTHMLFPKKPESLGHDVFQTKLEFQP